MELYADCILCCPLLSGVEYVPHALLMLEKKMGQLDGHQTVTLHDATDVMKLVRVKCKCTGAVEQLLVTLNGGKLVFHLYLE